MSMLGRAAVLVAALLCCAGVATAADAPGGQKIALRYVTPSITAQNWTNFIAAAKGFYDREGISVDMTAVDPTTLLPALIGGSAEISLAPAGSLIVGVDKGAHIVAVGAGADRIPYSLMAAPGIKTLKDLKGKKIGAVAPYEAYTTVIKQILRKAGLDPEKDVDFVYGGGQNQRFAALIGGAVQAGLLSPPQDAKAAERGFTALAFTPDSYHFLQLSITTVRRDWAQQHADALRRYLRSQADASRWLNDRRNKAEALQILENATHSTPDEAEAAYQAYVVRVHDFPNNFCVMRPGMEALLTLMHETNQTTATAAGVDRYIDDEYCPK